MYQQKSVLRFETEVKSTIKIQIPANLKLSLSHLVIKVLCACSHSPLSVLQTLPKGSWHLIRRYLGRMVLLESCLYLQNDILVYKGWQRISTGRWIIRKCKQAAHKERVLLITDSWFSVSCSNFKKLKIQLGLHLCLMPLNSISLTATLELETIS